MLTARNGAPAGLSGILYLERASEGGSGRVYIGLLDDGGGRSWQTRKPVPSYFWPLRS